MIKMDSAAFSEKIVFGAISLIFDMPQTKLLWYCNIAKLAFPLAPLFPGLFIMVSDSRNNQARLKKAKNADATMIGSIFPLTTKPYPHSFNHSSLLSDLVKAAVVNSLISFNSIHLD